MQTSLRIEGANCPTCSTRRSTASPLNSVTGGYLTPADGCATYNACYTALAELEVDTHLHIHKESNILFPAVQGEPVDVGLRWA